MSVNKISTKMIKRGIILLTMFSVACVLIISALFKLQILGYEEICFFRISSVCSSDHICSEGQCVYQCARLCGPGNHEYGCVILHIKTLERRGGGQIQSLYIQER